MGKASFRRGSRVAMKLEHHDGPRWYVYRMRLGEKLGCRPKLTTSEILAWSFEVLHALVEKKYLELRLRRVQTKIKFTCWP